MFSLRFLKKLNGFLLKKLKKIKLLIFDVDGVLTDGNLFYDHQGNQLKRFNVKDGLGIRYLQKSWNLYIYNNRGERRCNFK